MGETVQPVVVTEGTVETSPPVTAGRGGAAGRLLLWAMLVSATSALALSVFGSTFERAYVLPGAVLVTIAVIAPIVYLARRGACDVFNPVVLAAWSYFFPAFALSGLLLAGVAAGPSLGRVPDPVQDIPRAQWFIALGYLGLVAGFALPIGRRLGFAVGRRLPSLDWEPRRLWRPGLVLLGVGLLLQVQAFAMGLIGYQHAGTIGALDALVRFFGMTMTIAVVLLWTAVFRSPGRLDRDGKVVVGVLLAVVPVMMVMTGSRATPLLMTIPIGVAYWYSRATVRAPALLAFGLMIVGALAVGMLYGTTFRQSKLRAEVEKTGSIMPATPPPTTANPGTATPPAPPTRPMSSPSSPESAATSAAVPTAPSRPVTPPPVPSPSATVAENRLSLGQQVAQAIQAAGVIGDRGVLSNLTFVSHHLAQRLDITTSLAVVVGRYAEMADRERELGLANNIWISTWTSVIPRAIWADKPVISDLRAYGALYYGVSHSSPAMTPMGDLLRNFGPWGVPLGMAALGLLLRVLYAALIEGGIPPAGRVAAYYLIVGHVSYESLFGPILPGIMRVVLVAALSLLLVEVVLRYTTRSVGSAKTR